MVERLGGSASKETTCRILLLAIFPAMLVIAQPDLGSGLVYMAIAAAILFVAGTKWTHFVVLGMLAVGIDQHRARRRAGRRRPGAEAVPGRPPDGVPQPDQRPAQAGLPAQAVDRGHRLRAEDRARARGATQTKLDFIPEHHTDFIFSAVGEEFGFAGCAIVLSLYALLLWRALRVLTMAKNVFGALVAGGIARCWCSRCS